jgi:hypothetical protein
MYKYSLGYKAEIFKLCIAGPASRVAQNPLFIQLNDVYAIALF